MEEVEKKPIKMEKGWHLRATYVDENGDIYEKGKFTGRNEFDVDEPKIDIPILSKEEIKPEQPKATLKAEEKNTAPSREEELMRRIDELQKLVNATLINKGTNDAIIINAKEEEKFGTIRAKDLPPDDYDKEEATFITRGRGRNVSVYYNNAGGQVLAPYKQPILFTYTYTEKHRRGNDSDIMHYAVYKTHSKAEKKFLRESPFYNVSIFESIVTATKYDMATANKMSNLAVWVESLKPDQLYGEAAKRGITLDGKTVSELKNFVMMCRFDEIEKEQKQFTEAHVDKAASMLFK